MKVVPAVAEFPSPRSFLASLSLIACLVAVIAEPMIGNAASLVLKGQWPGYQVGWPRAIALRNDHAYVATYPLGFQVIDLSSPASPFRAGVCGIPDARTPYGVTLAGDCACVAAGDGGLQVIDISDPAHPRSLAPVRVNALGVAAQGSFAYVLTVDEPSLRVFDLTDPARPRSVGSYSALYGSPNALALSGRYGYLMAGYKGLEVLDLNDPAVPTRVGACLTDNSRVVAVSGDYAYLAGYPCTLEVIDVSNPTAPKVLSKVAASSPVLTFALDLVVAGNYAYVAFGDAGLFTFDISNPARPLAAGRSPRPMAPRALAIRGDHLFVGSDWDELAVVDISDPVQPRVTGTFDTEQDQAGCVAVSGRYAYLGRRHMEVLDVQDPTQPRSAGTFASGSCFTVRGDSAYMLSGMSLDVLDLIDPTTPQRIRRYDYAAGHPEWFPSTDMAVAGDYIYLATVWDGLQILAFTDGPALKPIGSYPVTRNIYRLALSGNSACLTLYDDQRPGPALHVIDVTQPAKPRLAGVYSSGQTPGLSGPLVASGGRVYLTSGGNVEVIDISTPAKPQLVARLSGLISSPPVRDMALMGNHLYVAASGAGLLVYEMPALPAFNPPAIVEGRLRLSWNQPAAGMTLRQSASLTPPNWQIVSNTASTNAITLPISGTAGFFRLAK